ncbi:MAG TPA: GAF domain-containing protein, partial [Anaerolineae bacterium]
MMSTEQATHNIERIHTLWQKLAYELADIFDAHGVCAAVANEVAVYTQTTTVVGVSGPQTKYYDVWICDKDGHLGQTRWNSKRASFKPLIQGGKPVIQDKFSLSAAELINSELWQLPRQAILAVPLPVPGRYKPVSPPGVLCLIDPTPDCPINLETISPLATYVTIALDRAYLRHLADRQDIEFDVISDISYALTSTLSLQVIYNQLMEPVRRTLNIESISVGLIEPTSGDISFVDMLMGPLFKDLPPIRLKRGQGIAGWVAEHRQPLIINDVYADKRFYSLVDRQSGFQTHSMICIPLQVEERVIGVLQA